MGRSQEPAEPAKARRDLLRAGVTRLQVTNAASWAWTALTQQENNGGTPLGKSVSSLRAVVVLVVVHAYREDGNGEEIIRIISARRAEKHEIRRYQEQAMD
jgi:uncharacterized DUF497 family protein